MKTIKTPKLLGAIYTKGGMREILQSKNALLSGALRSIGLVFESSGDKAYTYLTKSGAARIVIGGGMIRSIALLPKSFDSKSKFLPYYDSIIKAFWGLDLHELGHNLFTDMSDPIIVTYPVAKYRGFLHSLFNIIEDPVIESAITRYVRYHYPYDPDPKQYFDLMIENLFRPQADSYKDDGSVDSFMQYLLLSLRCGAKTIASRNAVFDKYSSSLKPMIKDIVTQPNGTERLHLCVKLGEWIIDNIKEFSWEEIEEPARPTSGSFPKGKGGIPIPIEGGIPVGSAPGGEGEDPITEGVKPARGPSELDDGEDDVDVGGSDDDDDDKPGRGKEKKEKETPSHDMEKELDDVFIDRFSDGSDHEWLIAKDVYEVVNPEVIDKINERIDTYSEAINEVASFLTLFQGRNKPRKTEGFTRGKLNVFKAMQDDIHEGCDTKLFTQDIKRGEDVDLAVSLVVDNSGSMRGDKSVLATQAALVLAQACEWSNIPFECVAFTKTSDSSSGTSITIVQKAFEDDLESSKPWFAITDSKLSGGVDSDHPLSMCTFRGNSEEINLYYIWKKFADVKHKTKLMFVMCDGCTTGSSSELKKLIKDIEADDITVVGIGIECSQVANIYTVHQLFNSSKELREGLAPYLIDTLSQFAS